MKKVQYSLLQRIILSICILVTIPGSMMGFWVPNVSAQAKPADTQTEDASLSAEPTPPPTGVSLQLSPTFLSLIADPGKPVSTQFRVTNNNAYTESLRLQTYKFESTGQGITLTDVDAKDEFVQWVTFSENEFSLAAQETKTIRVTVAPSESASLGYYYAFAVTRTTDSKSVNGGASVSGSAAIPVLLNVKSPNAKRELQIVDVKTDKFVYEYLPTTVRVTIKNTGNVHVVPVGDIFIDWGGQKEIAVLRLNEGNGNILPQTERTFDAIWKDGFAVREPKLENGRPVVNDKKEAQFETKYDFQKADKFRIGKYTANVLVVYDNGERDIPMEASVSFWIVPWKIIGVGLLLIVFILIGLKSVIWNPVRKLLKHEKKG